MKGSRKMPRKQTPAEQARTNTRTAAGGGGIITTVAGNGTVGFSGDGGAPAAAELDNPNGSAVDSFGNLYFSDLSNSRIREVQ